MRVAAVPALVAMALFAAGCGDGATTGGGATTVRGVNSATVRAEIRAARRRAQKRQEARARQLEARRAQAARRHALRSRREAEREAEAESATEESASECDPNYEGACLDPNASDYDCEGGSGDGPDYTGAVTVVGVDHYGLDSDGDGVGCEAE